MRLSARARIRPGAARPAYDPERCGAGIVHLGLGAFHKAHQAVYTDDALAAAGGDWRVIGVSLRSAEAAAALTPQDGRYTLVERGPDGPRARVIGAIARAVAESREHGETLKALSDPAIRIISLTVTEKAYGIARAAGGVDPTHPAVAADLAAPRAPEGAIGLIVEGLRRRREAGAAPFAALCCDNLPDNGAMLRGGVVDFARRIDPDLAAWIEGEVAFPSTMVDRITPAATGATRDDAARLTGCADLAAVEAEPFRQWVIEDAFTGPRPLWEAGGALFVADVAPYERMKLRMLNGAHSMLAYAGFLCGKRHVREVMADRALSALVGRHLTAAAATLAPLPGMDFASYGAALETRFRNPALGHETRQIAMDGTEKLPQRLFEPAAETLAQGGDHGAFAFATALWMRYCLGRTDQGETYPLNDPREAEIAAAAAGPAPAEIGAALHALPGLFPARLREDPGWKTSVADALAEMLNLGVEEAVRRRAG
ncbi:MAG: mannitol dehydrogenase family protein [Pikeienuella sp.]